MFTVHLIGAKSIKVDADGFKVTPDNHLVFYTTYEDGGNQTTFMAAAGQWIYFHITP